MPTSTIIHPQIIWHNYRQLCQDQSWQQGSQEDYAQLLNLGRAIAAGDYLLASRLAEEAKDHAQGWYRFQLGLVARQLQGGR